VTRRDLLRALLALPIAATLDVEQLLWVPKPIIVVPAMPVNTRITGETVVRAWEEYVGLMPIDTVFNLDRRFLRGIL
jgi:hypothetical protein